MQRKSASILGITMKHKIFVFVAGLLTVFLLSVSSFAQKNCDGKQLFVEKACAGDALDGTEKQLLKIINDYRAANKLPAVQTSDALNTVANRHLIDLNVNLKRLTHGWSNCPYDIKNEATWGCVLNAPKMLGVKYDGNGYENLYRNLNSEASPPLALEAWKKSEMHNALILNLGIFKDLNWDGIGIAISGGYAAIWVGARDKVVSTRPSKGLGVTFDEVIAGLSSIVPVQRVSTTGESDKWSGASADKTITFEIFGRKEDIAEAAVGISIKLDKNLTLSDRKRLVLNTFLKNLVPNWSQRESWADAAVKNLINDRRVIQSAPIGERFIEVTLSANGVLSARVKPNNSSSIKQF